MLKQGFEQSKMLREARAASSSRAELASAASNSHDDLVASAAGSASAGPLTTASVSVIQTMGASSAGAYDGAGLLDRAASSASKGECTCVCDWLCGSCLTLRERACQQCGRLRWHRAGPTRRKVTALWQPDTLIDGFFNAMLHVADLESINWTFTRP